ncbi:conjugative transposon protein TraM [Algoriphagus aquimarinus]|uniref:Bacteroides conjugative transposon TraM protein n=1 Tax=Algoriphagus aquimarinus TaxID=237018 RepID=A0A1I1BHW4_9BACT|nr:conjugative transposon protein TraM [Algoriphagus aquimarinus]SFB49969.1 Bacteroides conjugative transposon TraM protein [Algoriphagus aquimarinus]
MTDATSQKQQQKRKFLLMLPLLTLPFLTLTFWAMGGGNGTDTDPVQTQQLGINLELPGIANNKTQKLDKLGHYKKSRTDSARFLQAVKNDPYYRMAFNPEKSTDDESQLTDSPTSEYGSFGNSPMPEFQDPNELLIMAKLEALNQTLSQDPTPEVKDKNLDTNQINQTTDDPTLSADLDRLDQMMQQMQAGNATEDPEMQQMSMLLEQILDIQHPERVQARIRSEQINQQSEAFSVVPISESGSVSSLESSKEAFVTNTATISRNGFYGLESQADINEQANSIKAVIHETQTLTSGATVKLRLTEAASINGLTIPKDQLVYGTASLNGERLNITIQHIRVQDKILPVALKVHDADGMEGIYIPGSLSREATAQSSDRAIQGFGISTFDTSLEAQAASAGIETAKSFLSKKTKLIQFTLKAGYQIWLSDEKSKSTF